MASSNISLDDAFSKLKIIEERLSSVESVASNSISTVADNSAVEIALNEYKLQILTKLKSVRDKLVSEDSDIISIRNERDLALQQVATLKKENDRLNYRVRHLIKSLEEEEKKLKP